MSYTRREFAKLALAALPATAVGGRPLFGSAFAQAKPNSLINGVQIGVITYSYRSMTDQGGEATLRYVCDSGINAIELMDGPAERFAGMPTPPPNPAAANRGGGRAGGRLAAAGGPPPCVPGQGPAPRGQNAGARGGRRGGAAAELTPEQRAYQAAMQEYQAELKKWRLSAPMDRFRALRQMYNDAGVTIYAYKPDGFGAKNMQTSDEEFDYLFTVAATLGASHLTMELPGGDSASALMKRLGDLAVKHKVYVAYHTHAQGSMTAFDQALALSPGNMINVDFGHYVAAGNPGGTVLQFMEKHHGRIVSFHLKDRTLPINCQRTVPFGTGDAPLTDILRTMQRNRWTFPATIELEYPVPEGSDAVKEVAKCVEYCRQVLA